jgi:hypothetical protein
MFGLDKIGLDLRIGSKLGITSGIGVLLVAAIIVSQMLGSSQIKESSANVVRNDANALAAVNAKASARGMQLAGRDLHLASAPEDIKKAGDTLIARHDGAVKFADYLVKNAASNPQMRAALPKQAVAARRPAGRAQAALATAPSQDQSWKEF